MKLRAREARRQCGVLILALLQLAAGLGSMRAACPTTQEETLDLSTWTMQQFGLTAFGELSAGPAEWSLSASNRTVTQLWNADPAVLLSPFPLATDLIQGSFQVATDFDDDFIGFVFGYQDAGHFYLFDWKQGSQTWFGTDYYADAGMSVKRICSEVPLGFEDLFVTTNAQDRVRLLHHNRIPWQDRTEYRFSLKYEPGRFLLSIREGSNLLSEISLEDTNYVGGRFGFYNFSQDQVQYSGFTRRVMAPPPVLQVLPASVRENNSGQASLVFPVQLSGENCLGVTVDYELRAGTAVEGVDYSRVEPGRLTFLPGVTNLLVTVPVHPDCQPEPDEDLRIVLSHPTNAVVAVAEAVGVILDDDNSLPPVVVLEPPAGDGCWTYPTDLPLTALAADADGVIERVEFVRDDAVLLGWAVSPPYTLTWTNVPVGNHAVTAVAWDDCGLARTSAVVSVRVQPVPGLAVGDTRVVEGSMGTQAVFKVTLDVPSCHEVRVDVETLDGTAVAGLDYRAVSTNLVFQPGQTSAVVVVPVLGDTWEEPDETFSLCLGNVSGARLVRPCGVGTILNDDYNQPPQVAITAPAEGSVFSVPPGYVAVQASAVDVDGVVTQVQFQVNGQLAATRAEGPYAVLLNGLPVGVYTLQATAVDDRGAWATSAPVHITLRACDPALAVAPLTNQTRCVCEEVHFAADITSAEPVSIRWYANGRLLTGHTNPTLRLASLRASDAGLYTVEVQSPCAMVTRSATLTLGGAGNANPITFTNAGRITIYDNNVAAPYPSSLAVDCVPGPIKHLWVTLAGFSHNFPDDVDILLAGPAAGGVVPAVRLLSDAGGGDNVTNLVLTFTDLATNRLPNATVLQSGVYAPTDYDTPLDSFPLPAPSGVTTTNFTPFLGGVANGTWSLFVRDDLGGDGGSIAGGWTLTIEWEDTPPRLLTPRRSSDGSFLFMLTGMPRMTHVVEASADMVRWEPVSTNTLSGPTWITIPPNPLAGSRRFFRAVRCP